jgi:hypothetical protein
LRLGSSRDYRTKAYVISAIVLQRTHIQQAKKNRRSTSR